MESKRLKGIKELAEEIVSRGWFAPSVQWEETDEGGVYLAKWSILWTESLRRRVRESGLEGKHQAAVAERVDKAVRERISPQLKASVFRSLRPRYGVPHTPLEKWIFGLLEKEPQEVADWFAEDVLDYLHELERKQDTAPFRLALVLLEPDAGREPWVLVPGLQAMDDPHLFVPAATVWAVPEPDPVFAGRRFPAAQDILDQALVVAAEHLSVLARIRPGTSEVELTEEEAVHVLRSASALEAEGIRLIVPPWWNEAAPLAASITYTSVKTKEIPDGSRGFDEAVGRGNIGFAALMAFKKELLLNGKPITEADWQRLSGEDSPIVYYGGSWARLRKSDRLAVKRFFQEESAGMVSAGEALQTVLSMEADGEGGEQAEREPIPLRVWRGDGWLKQMVSALRDAAGESVLDAPAGLQGQLREYQQRGFSWLVRMRQLGFGACLADDMGLGKTVQWIAYALYVREQSSGSKRPFLLICPTSVLGNWQRELQRFAPSLSVYLHYGPDRSKGLAFSKQALEHDIVLTSYSTAQRDSGLLRSILWDTLTLDEAQYIKNPQTKLAQLIFSLQGQHRIAMTGTPLENKLSDLWSLFAFINPGYLGSERQFRRAFEQGGTAALQRLHRLIQPFLLRRMKSDEGIADDLPEKTERTAYCGMTERQLALYEAALRRMEERLRSAEGMKRRGVILAAITKLKQICNAPEHALRARQLQPESSGKLMRLEELLQESLSRGGRSIVFTQYAYMAKLLQSYLAERFRCNVGLIIGQTPRKEREEMVRSFQEEADGPRILVLTLKAGGFGLNLTSANQLIHYDRWWNPAAERQATDRLYRIGQTRDVTVWKLVTKGTLEEAIEQLLERKEQLAKYVVGKGETWITEYSDEQLQELLSLRGWDADDRTLRVSR